MSFEFSFHATQLVSFTKRVSLNIEEDREKKHIRILQAVDILGIVVSYSLFLEFPPPVMTNESLLENFNIYPINDTMTIYLTLFDQKTGQFLKFLLTLT